MAVCDGCLPEHLLAPGGAGLPHKGATGGGSVLWRAGALVHRGEAGAPQHLAASKVVVVVEGAEEGGGGVGEVVAALLDPADGLAEGGGGDGGVGVHQLRGGGGAGAHCEGGAGCGL